MHPKRAALVAYCDAEAGQNRGRPITTHLAKCETCRDQVARIRSEKTELAAGLAAPALDRRDLAVVLSAVSAWQEGRADDVACELRSRLHWQIATYLGSPAVAVVERPGGRAEELLGTAGEIFEVFLGPQAAQAVKDEALRGLDWAGEARRRCR